MIKPFLRTFYRTGYRVAPFVWRFTRPKVEGAMLAILYEKRVLFVRNSYRPEWSLPGGGVKSRERPVDAASREAMEEVGWRTEPRDLREIGTVTYIWRFRNDNSTIFKIRTDRLQTIAIDHVEVVEARFLDKDEAAACFLQPHVRHFLDEIYR